MNRKGFSLVELLATIVVLSIVLVIAVPSINNIIDAYKRKTFHTNATNLVKAVKEFYQQNNNGSLNSTDATYEIQDGNILFEGNSIDLVDVKIDGTGFIQITDNGESKIVIGNDKFCGIKEFSQSEVVVTDKANGSNCG